MAWTYCDFCREGMGFPSISECVHGVRECPNCGKSNEVSRDDLAQTLTDLDERIRKLDSFCTTAIATLCDGTKRIESALGEEDEVLYSYVDEAAKRRKQVEKELLSYMEAQA